MLILSVLSPLIECYLLEGRDLWGLCQLIRPKYLELCLTPNRGSINICWMNLLLGEPSKAPGLNCLPYGTIGAEYIFVNSWID